MKWPRAFIHVDMDTFFVSVERKHDPSLVGKPVIVGGGPGGRMQRGVVAACSYETRVFGVHSAMPLTRALRLCPQAILVPVGRSNYGVETRRVRAVLESFTDLFEMTSPDEAYVDLAGTRLLHGPPIAAAHKLRTRISEEVGLPVSVGLATSKTVAKIASRLAKPNGMFAALPGSEAAVLRPLPIRRLPGLGPKTAGRLASMGVRTLGELAALGESSLVSLLGEHGRDLYRRALGRCDSGIHPARERVQISTEETFGEDIGDRQRLHGELARMTMKLGERLRRKGRWAGTLTLKLRDGEFRTRTRQVPLKPPTHDDRALYRSARELFDRVWSGEPLRLIGVGVSNLDRTPEEDLFSAGRQAVDEKLLETLDRIRQRKGGAKVAWGAAAPPRTRDASDDPPRRR